MLCQNEILRRRSSRKLLAECFCWSEIGDWLVQSLFSWSARAQCDTGTVHAKTAYLELTDSLRGPQFEARLRQCRTRRRQQQQATPAAEWNVATIAAVWVTSPPLRAPPPGAPRETWEARTPLWLGICWRALHMLPRFVYLSWHPHGKMSRL